MEMVNGRRGWRHRPPGIDFTSISPGQRSFRARLVVMDSSAIIIYGSIYGSARTYALELGRRTGIRVVDSKEHPDLGRCDTIVYIGSLYAGGMTGLEKTFKGWDSEDGSTRIFIASVGIADPSKSDNCDHIRSSLAGQLPVGVYRTARFFHLRGCLDYRLLSFRHRAMMWMLVRMISGRRAEDMSDEDRQIVETYGRRVDFIDPGSLDPLVRALAEPYHQA